MRSRKNKVAQKLNNITLDAKNRLMQKTASVLDTVSIPKNKNKKVVESRFSTPLISIVQTAFLICRGNVIYHQSEHQKFGKSTSF